ncbi:MAG: hypothetical protein FJ091_22145 [Deltaproteobacteria bacterium]|nr:hypothetical protein [Deltaproteobacteria bacterium]
MDDVQYHYRALLAAGPRDAQLVSDLCNYFEQSGGKMKQEVFDVIVGVRSLLNALASKQDAHPDEADEIRAAALVLIRSVTIATHGARR